MAVLRTARLPAVFNRIYGTTGLFGLIWTVTVRSTGVSSFSQAGEVPWRPAPSAFGKNMQEISFSDAVFSEQERLIRGWQFIPVRWVL